METIKRVLTRILTVIISILILPIALIVAIVLFIINSITFLAIDHMYFQSKMKFVKRGEEHAD